MTLETALTPEEVAKILKIAKYTVYELVKKGELPSYRVGRNIRFDIKDVEAYKQKNKTGDLVLPGSASKPGEKIFMPMSKFLPENNIFENRGLVVCGQDVLLDILTRHLEKHPKGCPTFRHHVGSFNGLLSLYQGYAHLAAVHLWDGDQNIYNIPFVRRLLPGIPVIIVHLAVRTQGFYVAAGNPKKIKNWQDLTRSDVVFINREKGCGTRVLLDEKLRVLKLDRRSITGYDREEMSHLAVASTVARDEADVGLGNEKASLQVREIDFIPLQKERYEIVIKKEDLEKPPFQAVLEILQSREFKDELLGLGDYDLTETGQIVAEI